MNENKNVDLSFLYFSDLSQGNSVYPPNIYLFVVSIDVIVIPLLSHLLWKSSGVEPSLDFLYNNSDTNFLLFSHNLTRLSSTFIFDSNNFLLIISPNFLIESEKLFIPSSKGKNFISIWKSLISFIFSFNDFILFILFSILIQLLINNGILFLSQLLSIFFLFLMIFLFYLVIYHILLLSIH